MHYPLNPDINSLAGPKGDLAKAVKHLGWNQFDEGIAFLIPEVKAGNPEAQYVLARLYMHHPSLDVSRFSRDICQETFWMDKAARQGHAKAQSALSFAYKNGVGVFKDYEKSYLWALASQKNELFPTTTSIPALYQDKLSDVDIQNLNVTFQSWDYSHEPSASIIRTPTILGYSSLLGLYGLESCGMEVSWIIPLFRDIYSLLF
ncbi:MAG: hypothetical protein COB59_01715 [Rhodospirillaceae bacterium]|nr:MAG: hypothetical protein COB59_01715 [Rhodospirillaceae bacterium]